jgi:hypothetical protein
MKILGCSSNDLYTSASLTPKDLRYFTFPRNSVENSTVSNSGFATTIFLSVVGSTRLAVCVKKCRKLPGMQLNRFDASSSYALRALTIFLMSPVLKPRSLKCTSSRSLCSAFGSRIDGFLCTSAVNSASDNPRDFLYIVTSLIVLGLWPKKRKGNSMKTVFSVFW